MLIWSDLVESSEKDTSVLEIVMFIWRWLFHSLQHSEKNKYILKYMPSYWLVDSLRKHIQFWSSFIATVPLAVAVALYRDKIYVYWLICYRNLDSMLITTVIFAITEPVVSTSKSALICSKMTYFQSRLCFYYKSFRKSKCLYCSCKEKPIKGEKYCWIVSINNFL